MIRTIKTCHWILTVTRFVERPSRPVVDAFITYTPFTWTHHSICEYNNYIHHNLVTVSILQTKVIFCLVNPVGHVRVEDNIMDQVTKVLEPGRQFSKDSVRLVKRCTKPDRKGKCCDYSFSDVESIYVTMHFVYRVPKNCYCNSHRFLHNGFHWIFR